MLFVGTKKQAQDVVAEEALRCGGHYMNQRWLGGTLTNFVTIHAGIQRMRGYEEQKAAGFTRPQQARGRAGSRPSWRSCRST